MPLPDYQLNTKLSLHVLYLVQLGIWIITCASHCFFEERSKDYVMMFIHHIVTIGLVAVSYFANYVRIGTVVLLLHDASDVWIDLLKLFNYMMTQADLLE